MGRRYRMPFWSRVANKVMRLLPIRVLAWAWLNAYDELDLYMRDVKEMEDDGYTYLSSVSAIQLENRKRELLSRYLKAELM